MTQQRIPAVFIRGGTSKGVFFHARDLPPERAARDAIFLKALGSPDAYGRQLDGLGGGISSLSKAVVIEPSARDDADVDYTFAQVVVGEPIVDYSATCGNLSSAVGPFAVDEGLITAGSGEALVRVFNTNTSKLFESRFAVADGRAVTAGDFALPGVSGTGARISLDYLDPGGAMTGRLLPTGRATDRIDVPGLGEIEASLVDASNPVAFVAAADVGKTAGELPETLEADTAFMARLDAVRRAAGVAMGLGNRPEDVPLASPKIAIVAPPLDFEDLSGAAVRAGDMSIAARMISMERLHRAVPLTGAMCIAAACRIDGTIPNRLERNGNAEVGVGTPSGVIPVGAKVARNGSGDWHAEACRVFRTQRRLMEGWVLVP
ncbi:MAG: PrpF family protein [Hyphomicrobiales bacterium]|nr:PrpF family protein [Hyphomicrobiales bacterium]